MFDALANASLAENDGYRISPLKNIGMEPYQLAPYSATHKFCDLAENYVLEEGAVKSDNLLNGDELDAPFSLYKLTTAISCALTMPLGH